MKIYTWIGDDTQLSEFLGFLSDNNLHKAEYFNSDMYYCIDNTLKDVDDVSGDKIPLGCLMLWDKDLIQKTYRNEIIGRFNQGKPQWTLMNADAMLPMINVLSYGASKYDRNNWAKACPKRLDLMDSLMRHSMKIIAGESVDPESGLPHIGHLMCNAMFYSYWEQKTNGKFENFDDLTS